MLLIVRDILFCTDSCIYSKLFYYHVCMSKFKQTKRNTCQTKMGEVKFYVILSEENLLCKKITSTYLCKTSCTKRNTCHLIVFVGMSPRHTSNDPAKNVASMGISTTIYKPRFSLGLITLFQAKRSSILLPSQLSHKIFLTSLSRILATALENLMMDIN